MTRGAGKSISDRSGKAFPYREMITEPGTKLQVHYTESDGMWNMLDHPQNHIKGKSDKMSLKNGRAQTGIEAISSAILHADDASPILQDPSDLPIDL